MTTPLAESLSYGKFRGNITAIIPDMEDEGPEPDLDPVTGFITFTPTVNEVTMPVSNSVIILEPRTIPLAEDGSFFISLVATDNPAMGGEPWQYEVTFRLTEGRKLKPFKLEVPADSDRYMSQVYGKPPGGGVVSPLSIGFAGYPSPSTIDADLQLMVDAGAEWVRFDIDWASIQGTSKTIFNWADTDMIVDKARAHGLKVLGLIAYCPGWASDQTGVDHPLPRDYNEFATFCSQVATRYKGRISAYEVWNEPNLQRFWGTASNASQYVSLLKLAYPAIKAVSPDTPVLTAGLAPALNEWGNTDPRDFIKTLYADGGKPYFDHLALHPYGYPALPSDVSTASWNQGQQVKEIRNTMVINRDSRKQIWMTEFGAPTGNGAASVSLLKQAAIIADGTRYFPALGYCGPLFIYQLADWETGTGDVEDNFGLVFDDRTKKPAYSVIQEATGKA